jgi:secondary thiamine-phosphate synthase enzyme
MMIKTIHRQTATRGDNDVRDLTDAVQQAIEELRVREGTVTVFVPGATAGVTTIEFEPGVVADLTACFDRLAPQDLDYAHERAWHDGNGHAHIRAGLLGPSLTVPFADGHLLLGTWQQIVLVDFDNRPRQRSYTITVVGQ